MRIKLDLTKINSRLHWTTLYSEKLLLAVIGLLTIFAACSDVYEMLINMKVELGVFFLLFIYAEIIRMVGEFHISNRIPVTVPSIIAMTAFCRVIVVHAKEADTGMLVAEAGASAVLAGAAYIMSYKEKLSLEKDMLRGKTK